MSIPWESWVLSQTKALAIDDVHRLQSLWGGYGELLRVKLQGAPSVILKRVLPPPADQGSVSDSRKRRSYQVELAWYRALGSLGDFGPRTAQLLGARVQGDSMELLLEDLAVSGFAPARPPLPQQRESGLRWLAQFHARFLGAKPEGLWQQGGYWHLETRWQEWERMAPSPWKSDAQAIDRALRGTPFQTLVHGDSKPANFLWNSQGEAAAVDFQYVGTGCGMSDVAYFLDCCYGESLTSDVLATELDLYFQALGDATGSDISPIEEQWRPLFPVAWSDYQRFYLGWSGSARMGDWSEQQMKLAQEHLCALRLK